MLEFDNELQKQIITASLDDFSPNSALSNTHGGQDGNTPHIWREAVLEFIHDMLIAGLIAPLPGQENYQKKSAEEIVKMLRSGDAENGFDAEFTWNVIYFTGTEKLSQLLQDLKLNSWESMNFGLSLPLGKALSEMKVVCL